MPKHNMTLISKVHIAERNCQILSTHSTTAKLRTGVCIQGYISGIYNRLTFYFIVWVLTMQRLYLLIIHITQKLVDRWLQYIVRNMHTVFALLCFVVVIHWLIFPYPSGLLHWHCGNLTIAPVPAKQPWWIWIHTSCEFIMNDWITTTKQNTTKPCAYFLGYTVCTTHRLQWIYEALRRGSSWSISIFQYFIWYGITQSLTYLYSQECITMQCSYCCFCYQPYTTN